MNARSVPLGDDLQTAADVADNLASYIVSRALEFSGFSSATNGRDMGLAMQMATAHMQVTTMIYVVHWLTAAIREVAPEIAGAISEAGTDIGAGLAEGLRGSSAV